MALVKSIIKDTFFIDQLSIAVNSEAIVSATDLHGNIVYVNENFCTISGYAEDELIGNHHRIINSNYHQREFFEKMWKDITSGKTWKGEIKNKRKDGTFYWVLSTIIPIKNQQGEINYFISVRQDITEQKEIQASFIQASKISALGEVTAKIAHELNNPLAIIMGMAQMLVNRNEVNENGISKVKKILNASERMNRLIQQMKKHSRNTKDDPKKPLSLDIIIKNSLILLEASLATHHIKMNLNLPSNLPLIFGEIVHLESVIMNFLSNSIDAFIKPHSNQKIENRTIDISILIESEFVNLIYKDNAGGIPDHVQKHMFDTFFTTKEAGKGTGLGLSMIKNIIDDHKAKLSFNSVLGQGTEFIVKFPIFHGIENTNYIITRHD